MEIGETVSIGADLATDGKCIICSQAHDEPKRDEIQEVAPNAPKSRWGRKSMSGVFDWVEPRKSIYLHGRSPSYTNQGHHCVALSSFVENANTNQRRDRRLRLNHFLNKIGYYPNRKQNCILLPVRRSYGDFDAFWKALDQDKPLQMHGPGHDQEYFGQCDRLLSFMVMLITDPEICTEQSQQDWENELREIATQAENYGFRHLANNEIPWRLHPMEQHRALRLYFLPEDESLEVLGVEKKPKRAQGLGNAKKEIQFPDLALDVGPFASE
jgi:hypothetical protein